MDEGGVEPGGDEQRKDGPEHNFFPSRFCHEVTPTRGVAFGIILTSESQNRTWNIPLRLGMKRISILEKKEIDIEGIALIWKLQVQNLIG